MIALPTLGNDRNRLGPNSRKTCANWKGYGHDYVPGLLAELAEQDILG